MDVTAAQLSQVDTVDEMLAKRLLSRGLNRGAFSRKFDKDGLARCHMTAAREYRKLLEEDAELPLIYHFLEKQRLPKPFDELNKIDLSGLDQRVIECEQGKTVVVHLQDALYGRLCVPAFKAGGVHTVLEDSNGRAIPVVIHHVRSASDYPVGMEVAIAQPLFMTLTRPDKCLGIMVDNPTYLVDLSDAGRVPEDPERNEDYAVTTAGCSEYIGPMEIGIGKEEHNTGRRGLFAQKLFRQGELVLRTKALATGENKRNLKGGNMWGLIVSGLKSDHTSLLSDHLIDAPLQDLVTNLVRLLQQHPRCAHQLYSLALSDSPTTEIPPLDLFDPAIKDYYDPCVVDINLIRRIVMTNVAKTGDGHGSGLWALPSFLNHSCDPNCMVSYEGDVQVIRAFSEIPSGLELTVGYWDTERTWFYRQKKARGFRFACACPRCDFERQLAENVPKFADLSRQWHESYEAQLCEMDLDGLDLPDDFQVDTPVPSPSLRNEVENLLQLDRRCATMTPQQKDWVRTSFSQTARAYSSSSSSHSHSRRLKADTSVRQGRKLSVVRSARLLANHSSVVGWFLPRRLSTCRPLLRLFL